jgi:hypothetical protein
MPIDRSRPRRTRYAFFLAATLAVLPAAGADFDRIASFSAGDPPPFSDVTPSLAAQPGGSFLLTWQQSGSDHIPKIRSRRFDAAGRPLGPAVELWEGFYPQVAPLPDGGFVATSQLEQRLRPLTPPGIGLHRLDAFGRPVGESIVIAIDPDSFAANGDPRLAVAPNGSVAIVWLDDHVVPRGQFFDAALNPRTAAIPISPFPPFDLDREPNIAFRADGTALVVWSHFLGNGSFQIFGRRFSASGEVLSEAFPISHPEDFRVNSRPHVLARPDGGWWVGWDSYILPPAVTNLALGEEIRVVRLSANGVLLGAEQAVAVQIGFFDLGTDPTGNLLVIGNVASTAVSGQLFDRDGKRASSLVNFSGTGIFGESALAHGSPTGFFAAWKGFSPPTLEGADLFGAILTPTCLEGKSAACLGPDGRYGVEVAWEIGASNGTAKPLPLAENVATFGLHNAADHDVTVLLSGPGSRDLTFAATTGAKVEIHVTDKQTGAVRTFNKPAGRFASGRFPNALPSLAGGSDASAVMASVADDETKSASLATLAAVGEICMPTRRALCLLSGRFRAELLAGQYPNPALAILRTDKSGTFAFPSAPETPLVTLTMIDGRASNGKFWVYLGGLSLSGYKVRITDLSAGVVKTYANPVGKLESRADRTAF